MENMSEIKPPLGASHNSAHVLHTSDESEPSWLEPQLELKDFQLGSARDLFYFSSKSKIGQNEPKFWFF